MKHHTAIKCSVCSSWMPRYHQLLLPLHLESSHEFSPAGIICLIRWFYCQGFCINYALDKSRTEEKKTENSQPSWVAALCGSLLPSSVWKKVTHFLWWNCINFILWRKKKTIFNFIFMRMSQFFSSGFEFKVYFTSTLKTSTQV